ncbi:DUF4255 domain-containing protein [Maribacter algicola]|uniref:DUF4255 domain-containing protein n=1 Tax=Maribacter algicola TaxID=2498892 RepID=A0A3R8PXZ2_9FLAO|nr:DUF4255 domain-containing protein [Maribacter algicola]RRQ48389.1 DUF4255 domain-containing protein [Maribacter algicola]
MIHTALEYIKNILNERFNNKQSSKDLVDLSNIFNMDGSLAKKTDDKIVFFLLGLNEERVLKNTQNRTIAAGQSSLTKKQAPLYLNFQIMFCANFSEGNYVEGLNYLSNIIRFFHTYPKINPPAQKGKEDSIGKLTFELCNLDYSELSNVWSAVGGKLMPSLIYKVGMLVFEDTGRTGETPSIQSTESIL